MRGQDRQWGWLHHRQGTMTKPVDADNMEIVRLRTDTTHCSAAPTNKTMAPAFSISIAFHFKRAGSRYHYLLNVRGGRESSWQESAIMWRYAGCQKAQGSLAGDTDNGTRGTRQGHSSDDGTSQLSISTYAETRLKPSRPSHLSSRQPEGSAVRTVWP